MTATPEGDPFEPDVSFLHASLKVRWAEQHIQNLKVTTEQLIQSYQKAGLLKVDAQRGRFSIENHGIPPEIALHAGDAIFSLRSALDCCWMGLKRAIDAAADKATLPRANDRNGVKGQLKRSSVEQSFQGSDDFILDKIRPYRDGREPIWFAAQLDNWNKHNMLLLAVQKTTLNNLYAERTEGDFPFTLVAFNNQYEGRGSFGLLNFGAGAPVKQRDSDATVEIILESRKPVDKRPLMAFLFAALKETDEAVKLFASTFGKKAS